MNMATSPSSKDLEARLAAVERAMKTGPVVQQEAAPADPQRVRDLVLRAASDPEFATQLITNPEKFGTESGLSAEQVERVRLLSGSGMLNRVLESRGVIPSQVAEGGGGGYY
jgi:hypothetical protein